MSRDAADETAIAAAIFAVDEALPLEPATAAGASGSKGAASANSVSRKEVDDALAAYKQFMVLKAVSKDFDATKLSPPPLVDEIWHEHILDTRGYRAFCDAAFKQFVDHDPDGVLDCGARRVRRAATFHYLKLCFKDEYNMEIWNYPLENSCKRKYAAVKDEPEPQPSTPRGSLNIRIRDQTGGRLLQGQVDDARSSTAATAGLCGELALSTLAPGRPPRHGNFDISMEDGDHRHARAGRLPSACGAGTRSA